MEDNLTKLKNDEKKIQEQFKIEKKGYAENIEKLKQEEQQHYEEEVTRLELEAKQILTAFNRSCKVWNKKKVN